MRKLVVLAVAVAGIFAYRKWRETEEEKAVWSRETDRVD
ncbi:DLW-39 family protein [Zhihengliuella halotolerans]|nr:DLW-39 family protein [Zhihengliuella halotolerans]